MSSLFLCCFEFYGIAKEKPKVTVSPHSLCPSPGSCLKTSWVPSLTLHITMHSLDEPLDLKLSITKLRAAREKRERTLGVVRHHALHRELGLVDDSPTPGSPGSPPPGTVSMLVHSSYKWVTPAQFTQWTCKSSSNQGLWKDLEKRQRGAKQQ